MPLRFRSLPYARVIDHRPILGSGSCARCRDSLDLASIKVGDAWYCSSSCAEGRVAAERSAPSVPEPWLYARPRRFFGARRPKELKGGAARR
ncbi:MAG: hypothetical protein ACHQ3O_01615 [Candidatus Limnocylindria bacterium]